jgi:hypothetical protein
LAERYWSPGEVDALIPRLTEAMGGAMRHHEAAAEVRARLKQEQQRIAMTGGGVLADSWREDVAALDQLTQAIQEALQRVVALGGVPKDVGLGLVDFLHLRDGAEVNLCWKHGERAVRWWHGLDEGYSARKPL